MSIPSGIATRLFTTESRYRHATSGSSYDFNDTSYLNTLPRPSTRVTSLLQSSEQEGVVGLTLLEASYRVQMYDHHPRHIKGALMHRGKLAN